MDRVTKLFLVTYDRVARSSDIEDLGTDREAALRTYREKERELGAQREVEAVLLAADSVETLKRTHSSYFAADASAGLVDLTKTGGRS